MNFKLVEPSIIYHDSFIDALKEYHQEGELTDLDEQLIKSNVGFKYYVNYLNQAQHAEPPNAAIMRWLIVDDEIFAGRFMIRYHPDDPQAFTEGTLGYSTRPSMRSKGYAKKMLSLGLAIAKEYDVTPIIAVDINNVASQKVALSAGFKRLKQTGPTIFYAL